MKKRRILILLITVLLCLSSFMVIFATDGSTKSEITYRAIKISVNGTQINPVDENGVQTEPFILNGRTYLPIRAVADALGLDIKWDNATSTVLVGTSGTKKISYGSPKASFFTQKVTLTYRNISVKLDGKKVDISNSSEPFIYNNSTYLPVRAIATALGCKVQWDNATSTINVLCDTKENKNVFDFLKNYVITNGNYINDIGKYVVKYYVSGNNSAYLLYDPSSCKIDLFLVIEKAASNLVTGAAITLTPTLEIPYMGFYSNKKNGENMLTALTKVYPNELDENYEANLFSTSGKYAGDVAIEKMSGLMFSVCATLAVEALNKEVLRPNGYSKNDLGFNM